MWQGLLWNVGLSPTEAFALGVWVPCVPCIPPDGEEAEPALPAVGWVNLCVYLSIVLVCQVNPLWE